MAAIFSAASCPQSRRAGAPRRAALDHFAGSDDQVNPKVVLGLREWIGEDLQWMDGRDDHVCGLISPASCSSATSMSE